MNTKFLTGIVMTVGLLASGAASALPCTSYATTDAWAGAGAAGCTDPDGDMLFTFGAYSGNFAGIGATTAFNVTEQEIGGTDYYDVGFGFSPGYAGGGDISYTMSTIPPSTELIRSVGFDTIITGTGTTATKVLSDLIDGPDFLTLTSTDGSNTGYVGFSPTSTIDVVDTFNASTSGVFQDAHNNVTVPEPLSLSLFGIGLVGLGLNRRRRKS